LAYHSQRGVEQEPLRVATNLLDEEDVAAEGIKDEIPEIILDAQIRIPMKYFLMHLLVANKQKVAH
jgi:hypothetical protein